ncbi:MAG: ATP-binding cassette domain-containing protein, partial [Marinobacter sp.]|nr:ATP-binding cassette domain-containing protein [Marinobacter sp.]
LSQHYHDRAAALGAGAEILQRLESPVDNHCVLRATEIGGDQADPAAVSLADVSMAFGDQPNVLRNLSLQVGKGDVIALTGPSGGGKSTLLHLLAGFMTPDQGTVRVFGDVPGSFRFGWLGQKGFLVHGTWADNLRLTTPEASDVAIATALRNVGLGPLLDSRPEGIYSQVSEDGQGLSGGQARRLSLARLFLADYDLLLLDEPTAGLDSDSEIFVLEALHKLAVAGKTLIFATHHQALLTLADRVLVVSGGEVRDA